MAIKVSKYMTSQVISISPDVGIREAFFIMKEKRASLGLHDLICLVYDHIKQLIHVNNRGDDLANVCDKGKPVKLIVYKKIILAPADGPLRQLL